MAGHYGGYIASAAESERNRRYGSSQLDKQLEMRKYGIDTSAQTSADQLRYYYDVWKPKEARQAYTQTQLEESDTAKENVSNILLQQKQQEDLTKQQYEDVAKFRKGQQPSMWDIIKNTAFGRDKGLGTGGVKQWSTGLMDRMWGAIDPISKEDISGKPEYQKLHPNQLKNLDPKLLIELLKQYGQHSPADTGGRGDTSLLDLAKNANYQVK